jgi:hypothetical protein
VFRDAMPHLLVSGLGSGHKQHRLARFLGQLLAKMALAAAGAPDYQNVFQLSLSFTK